MLRDSTAMLLAARLVYEEHLNQQEAAERLKRDLGLRETPNQATVSRLLARAVAEKIVRVTIQPPPMTALKEALKEVLQDMGPIRDVVVVPRSLSELPEDKNEKNLAHAAAKYLLARVADVGEPTRITLACGETLGATVDEFMTLLQESDRTMEEGAKKTLRVYPLTLHADYRLMSTYPTTVVTALSRLTGRLRNYELAAYATSLPIDFHSRNGRSNEQYKRDRDTYLQNSQVQEQILDEASRADIFLCGIGTVNNAIYQTILEHVGVKLRRPDEYVAEVGYVPIREDGSYETNVARELVGVALEQLRRAAKARLRHVIAVAGGEKKKEAIRAALKAQCFNVLITDEIIAEHILAKERPGWRSPR